MKISRRPPRFANRIPLPNPRSANVRVEMMVGAPESAAVIEPVSAVSNRSGAGACACTCVVAGAGAGACTCVVAGAGACACICVVAGFDAGTRMGTGACTRPGGRGGSGICARVCASAAPCVYAQARNSQIVSTRRNERRNTIALTSRPSELQSSRWSSVPFAQSLPAR